MIDASTFRLDGRVALVTGSSTGIGLAIARGLAESGAVVVLNARQESRLEAAAAELAAAGHAVHRQAFDVSDETAVGGAVERIEREVGPIDILVNNAGMTRRAPFAELSTTDWRAVMGTNVDGVFLVSRAVARGMIARRRGRIINVCSIMSDFGRAGTTAYSTSKGAVRMLTRSMAVDLAPHGIQVNGLAPGYFPTELTAPIRANEDFNAWLVARTPAGRWGRLDELAPAAVFLASDAARFVHGHLLVVDGGLTASL
jgi:gluconate 5-dehydrogenase